MKRRIKKDNERRELLNIPVAESEMVEVPDSETEKDGEDKAKDDDKSKDEPKSSESHSHRDDRSAERRRTPPRRRPSPPRYRGYVSPLFALISCGLIVQGHILKTS